MLEILTGEALNGYKKKTRDRTKKKENMHR